MTAQQKRFMGLWALALGVLIASMCWMMLRFGTYAALLDGVLSWDTIDTEYKDWPLHAYIIMEVAMIPLAGKLTDIYGIKRVFFVGAIVFMIGALLSSLSTSFAMMSWLRAIQGVGAGIVIGVGFAAPGLVGKYFRGIPFGQEIMAGAFAIGSLFGAVTGYWLIDVSDSWKILFYFAAILMALSVFLVCVFSERRPSGDVKFAITGVSVLALLLFVALVASRCENAVDVILCAACVLVGVAIAAAYLFTFISPEDHPKRVRKVDVPGLVLLTGIFFLFAAFIQTVNIHIFEESPWLVVLPVAAVVLCYVLYRRNKSVEDAAFVHKMPRPLIFQIAVLVVVSVFVIGLLQLFMKAYLLDVEIDVYGASLMFAFLLLGAVVTSIIGSRFVASKGTRNLMLVGCAILIVALVLTYFMLRNGRWAYYGIMVVLGAGLGCLVTAIVSSVQMNTPVKDRGAATSFTVGSRMLAIIAGLAGVTSFVILKVHEYVVEVTGTPLSGNSILDIISAVASYYAKTGINITDDVVNRYITAFQQWTLISIVVVAATLVFVYFFYKGGDEVTFEQTEVAVKESAETETKQTEQ